MEIPYDLFGKYLLENLCKSNIRQDFVLAGKCRLGNDI
jgi:hypothetical protein